MVREVRHIKSHSPFLHQRCNVNHGSVTRLRLSWHGPFFHQMTIPVTASIATTNPKAQMRMRNGRESRRSP